MHICLGQSILFIVKLQGLAQNPKCYNITFSDSGQSPAMPSRSHTSRLQLLLAALLSLTLLTSSVFAAHVHKDGLPHYSDCDSCLQLSALDAIAQSAAPVARLYPASPLSSDRRYTFNSSRHHQFQARAPPRLFS